MASAVPRWATLDCYGTLIDWNAGMCAELERLFGPERTPRLLERYHELEPQAQADDPTRSYREVLRLALARLAAEAGVDLPRREEGALAESLPRWRAFPEVRPALEELRRRGWKLAILSNTDSDLLEASKGRIGVPIDLSIVASEIGSYKPAHGHWQRFFAETGAARNRHAHVAASLFHDIAPAVELGLISVWVNRLGQEPGPPPTREVPDLTPLPRVLDELVPA